MTKIGKNIKKIRNVKGLSQQAFADLFGITRGNISSYEESRAEPKIEAVVKIANYFGIPLNDFIEKELSVNELLHYNTNLVTETQKMKIARQLVEVPYISALYIDDFVSRYRDDEFLEKLPRITIPANTKFKLIAIETDNPEMLPSGFNFNKGDILVFEQVVKENIHRIEGKLGIQVSAEEMKWGIYHTQSASITMWLNEWVSYPFNIESDSQYWMLRASFRQE